MVRYRKLCVEEVEMGKVVAERCLVSKAIAAATGTVRLATVFIFLREAVKCSEPVHTTYENIDGRYMYSSIHSSEIFLFSFCPILRT